MLKVLKKRIETANVFSLILEKPKHFDFYAGQYLDIELAVQDKFGNSRAFTISSSTTEDFLMITTKKGVSPFKKFMEQLKTGDIITTSHPAGTFILDQSAPAIFIAGGIGITPFRSMVKYAADKKLTTPITLIYLNSGHNFLFKKELETWQKQLPNLEIVYINTAKYGHLKTLDTKYLTPNTIFYLAGPPKMVDDFEKILVDLGVDQTNIRYDRFDGY